MQTRISSTVRLELELLAAVVLIALALVLGTWADAVDGLLLP